MKDDLFFTWFVNNIDDIIKAYKETFKNEKLEMKKIAQWSKIHIYDDIPKFRCCICDADCLGYGNNPWPVVKDEESRCCDECNEQVVILARLKNIKDN